MTKAAPEFAGILFAIGFVVLGLIGLPIANWFLLAVLLAGSAVAFVFHLTRK